MGILIKQSHQTLYFTQQNFKDNFLSNTPLLNSQWSPSSKPPTTSLRPSRVPSPVPHETNKEIAKDSNAGVGTRLTAAKDAVGDKIDQNAHDGKAEVHKQAAKN